MKTLLHAVVAAATFLFCDGIALATTALTPADVAPYLHAQRLVDIGGRRLNIYCTGHGSPAVILDAGAGETTLTWRNVEAGIAKFTRVCSYDRAGLGFSDGGPFPRDANAAVHDLHALLHRAGISPPYVLVGHSEAGFYDPLYADRYLQEVAGIVLVDPSFPNEEREVDAVSPAMRALDAATPSVFRTCYEGALRRAFSNGSAAYAPCGFPPHWQALYAAQCSRNGPAFCEVLHAQLAQIRRPSTWLYLASENAPDAQNSAEVLRAQRSYGALPFIVLTAAHDEGDLGPLPTRELAALQHVLVRGDELLARSSSVGVDFVVHRSSHAIQKEHPSVVISAVAEVVSQARHARTN
jgi:pimeloyl-ACP methyl ester carboxylesterase